VLSSALIPRSIASDRGSRDLPSKSRASATFFLFKWHWTLVAPVKPEPVMVTLVLADPIGGLMPDTDGADETTVSVTVTI